MNTYLVRQSQPVRYFNKAPYHNILHLAAEIPVNIEIGETVDMIEEQLDYEEFVEVIIFAIEYALYFCR